MTETATSAEGLDEARTALAAIVDDLIAQNPTAVAQFNQVFQGDAVGGEWVSHGLAESGAAELDQSVEAAAEATDEDEEGLGIAALFDDSAFKEVIDRDAAGIRSAEEEYGIKVEIGFAEDDLDLKDLAGA